MNYICTIIVKTWTGKDSENGRDLFTWATVQVSGEVGLVQSINPHGSLTHPMASVLLQMNIGMSLLQNPVVRTRRNLHNM